MTTSPTTTEAPQTLLADVPAQADGVLVVDLPAIAENYRRLKSAFRERAVAAVVKADGYGLGAERVAPVLVKAGARSIFVAQLEEALKLRPLLDACHPAVSLYVLNGLAPGTEALFADNLILPVLNSLGQIEAWGRFARQRDKALPAAIHLDPPDRWLWCGPPRHGAGPNRDRCRRLCRRLPAVHFLSRACLGRRSSGSCGWTRFHGLASAGCDRGAA